MSLETGPGAETGFDTSGTGGPTSLHDPAAFGALARRGWVMLEAVPPLESQVAALLSPLGALMPQYGQNRFWIVEARDAGKGTSLGNLALRLHTELAEFESPPDYVALYAERPAADGGALLLCDVRPFLASLTALELSALLSVEMTVKAEGPIAERYGDFSYTGPILSTSPFGLRLRLDQHFIDLNGPQAVRDFRDRLMAYAERATLEVMQPKASLIIWDNRFVLHGRSAFEDGARRLWRCCIRGRS